MKKEFNYCKIVVVLLFCGLLFCVGLEFFVLDRKMTVKYDFELYNLRVFSLGPWYRLLPVETKDKNTFQYLKDSLIYFKVRIPPNFNYADVMIAYEANTNNIKIGAEKSKGKYEFVDTKVNDINSQKIAVVRFKLRELFLSNYYLENNKLEFAISAPGIDYNNMLKISGIDILLSKDITKQDFKNAYARIKQKIVNRK